MDINQILEKMWELLTLYGLKVVAAIVIFVIGRWVAKILTGVIRKMMTKADVDQTLQKFVANMVYIALMAFVVLAALNQLGVQTTSFIAILGAAGLAVGLALQGSLSNFAAGFLMILFRPIRVGDYIELDNGLTGTVKAINVRSTLINTNDNIDIVVPNSEFVTTRLTNWTLGERILRVRIPFGVAYGSDKELVKKAAIEACEDVSYTLTHMPGREPDVWLVEYGDNSLNFLLLVWVNRQGARRPTRTRRSTCASSHPSTSCTSWSGSEDYT